MSAAEWISILSVVLGALGVISGISFTLGRLIEVRRNLSDLKLEFESTDGERLAVELDPDDPGQARELAELFAKDKIVSVDPQTDSKEHVDGAR